MRARKPELSAPDTFALQCGDKFHPVNQPVREFRFHPVRRWRFDFAWPDRKIAVEVEGGTWSRGRHTRGMGYERDIEKYNTATRMGWKVFRYTTGMVYGGRAIDEVQEALQ